eukprot:TRINITY_DN14393_c0_g1_i4.p1 TRINITY_DN14393_c0_g1~~TRINITY_DN14393_c0_g1_i4.p1  ORF type:complete len:204 (+),score=35.45 TRINITY_DN14393_c0_g1_i4:33-644(+)
MQNAIKHCPMPPKLKKLVPSKMKSPPRKRESKNSRKVPVSLLRSLGAEKLKGEKLFHLDLGNFGSSKWKEFAEWVKNSETNPDVSATFAPMDTIVHSAICPPAASGVHIQNEARSIQHHCAPLMAADFAGDVEPALLGALAAPPLWIRVHHAKIGLLHSVAAISKAGVLYPFINKLHVGSYVVTASFVWANAVVTVHVFKSRV